MRTEFEIQQELKQVRKLLAEYRANGWDHDLLYGAQQALIWILKQGQSPSKLEATIMEMADNLGADDGAA